MTKDLAIKINKMIGERGLVVNETHEWTPFDIAVYHKFENGNKRTAFVLLELLKLRKMGAHISCLCNEDLTEEEKEIQIIIDLNKEWLDILKEC